MSHMFALAASVFGVVDRKILRRLPPDARLKIYAGAHSAKTALFGSASRAGLGLEERPTSWGVPRRDAQMSLPEWLRDDIVDVRKEIDVNFFKDGLPTPDNAQRIFPCRPHAGRAYRRLIKQFPGGATHLIVAPWMKRGGADLVVLKHLDHLIALGGRPVLLLTEYADSPWMSRVPAACSTINAGTLLADLTPYDRCLVLARLFLQSGARIVHNINSQAAWMTIRYFGASFAERVKIYASLYCDDGYAPDGRPLGYAHDYAAASDAFVDGYISDNATYLQRLRDLYGIDRSKLHLAYVPTERIEGVAPAYGAKRVLWAGRLDRQKRADLLLEIAKLMPDVAFDAWGASVLAKDGLALQGLKRQPNVSLRGSYDGFSALPVGDYGVFLYTSAWDGLPNVILEAGARKMPIVASDVGGVGELINAETGWRITEKDDPHAYVKALNEAFEPDEAIKRASALQSLVRNRHTTENFAYSVESVF